MTPVCGKVVLGRSRFGNEFPHLSLVFFVPLDVSKNRGTPKWMVKIMEDPIKIHDLGGPPLFLEIPNSSWCFDFPFEKICARQHWDHLSKDFGDRQPTPPNLHPPQK